MFNLQVLEHSFELLRPRNPSQALCVQNLTAALHAGCYPERAECQDSRDTWVAVDLPVWIVSDIVSALSDIADQAAEGNQHSRQQKIAIHRTLLAWMIYAQSFFDDQGHPGGELPFSRYS